MIRFRHPAERRQQAAHQSPSLTREQQRVQAAWRPKAQVATEYGSKTKIAVDFDDDPCYLSF